MSPEVSPYDWWSLRDAFPRLGLMAYDYLSIPAMSSECERIFSGAKLTLTT
jgi:hAT family C-terminal dimerisation region